VGTAERRLELLLARVSPPVDEDERWMVEAGVIMDLP